MKKFVVFLICVAVFVCGQGLAEDEGTADEYEHFAGWYMLGSKVQIPILEIGGEYYTSCRGFEMPLERYRGELKWKMGVSSMAGTMIGKDEKSGDYYIIIRDSQREAVENQNEEVFRKYGFKLGEKTALKKIDEPEYVLDAESEAPGEVEDFVGYYVPSMFAYVRMEITKQGDKYLMTQRRMGANGGWEDKGRETELKPMEDGLGFSINGKSSFVYNESLGRYEMVLKAPGVEDLKMPLSRVDERFTVDSDSMKVMTGVPAWH